MASRSKLNPKIKPNRRVTAQVTRANSRIPRKVLHPHRSQGKNLKNKNQPKNKKTVKPQRIRNNIKVMLMVKDNRGFKRLK